LSLFLLRVFVYLFQGQQQVYFKPKHLRRYIGDSGILIASLLSDELSLWTITELFSRLCWLAALVRLRWSVMFGLRCDRMDGDKVDDNEKWRWFQE